MTDCPAETIDDRDHFWYGCSDSRSFWDAARDVLQELLRLDRIFDNEFAPLQRAQGFPLLRKRLRNDAQVKFKIRAFTALALDMISRHRWTLHRHSKQPPSIASRILELRRRLTFRLTPGRF